MVLAVSKIELLGTKLADLLLVVLCLASRLENHGESVKVFCVLGVFGGYNSALYLFSELLRLELEVVWD